MQTVSGTTDQNVDILVCTFPGSYFLRFELEAVDAADVFAALKVNGKDVDPDFVLHAPPLGKVTGHVDLFLKAGPPADAGPQSVVTLNIRGGASWKLTYGGNRDTEEL